MVLDSRVKTLVLYYLQEDLIFKMNSINKTTIIIVYYKIQIKIII